MKYYISYPQELKKRRRELGITIQDVCDISRIDYVKIEDMENGRIQAVDAPMLEALCDAIDLDPNKVSQNYFARPHDPEVTIVHVHADMLQDHLRKTDMNANQLAKAAGVPAPIVYGFFKRGKRACKAKYAEALAIAMGVEPATFAPALRLYKATQK